jgi:glyoxylase-like metal-dependent hydrolase (beta-lactamase superfamily II)
MIPSFTTIIAACGLLLNNALAADPVPTFAPIPPSSNGPAPGPGGWRVEHFGGGAYMVTDNQYQAFFVVSTKGVIVVDAPPSIGRGLVYAIGNTTRVPVTHVVYSHAHADHIGGAFLFGPKVTVVAHRMTREILGATPDPNRPLPKVVFDDDLKLKVGNQTLLLSYKGLNHQPGNIFIYAPAQKVLMLVDIVYPG